jgi:hypothetical protein
VSADGRDAEEQGEGREQEARKRSECAAVEHGHAEGHARDRVRGGHHAFGRVMPSAAKSGTCMYEVQQYKWIIDEDSHMAPAM